MSERPQWCIDSNCPNSPGYGMCPLKSSLIKGWPRLKRRKIEYKKMETLAKNDPQKVIDLCFKASDTNR